MNKSGLSHPGIEVAAHKTSVMAEKIELSIGVICPVYPATLTRIVIGPRLLRHLPFLSYVCEREG